MLKRLTTGLLFAATATMFAAVTASAQTILGGAGFVNQVPASVTIHSGWAEPDGRRIVGIRMDMEPGWKTYWRSPGAAGIPPRFDWAGSKNIAEAEVIFPKPLVFDSFGMRTIGYARQMVLPVAITVEDPNRPVRLRLSLSYGLCEEVCVPAQQDLALDILPNEGPDAAALIQTALSDGPRPGESEGITAAACDLQPNNKAFEARLTMAQPPLGAAPVIIAEGDGAFFGPLESRIENGAIIADGEMRVSGGWVDRSAVQLTVLSASGDYLHVSCETD